MKGKIMPNLYRCENRKSIEQINQQQKEKREIQKTCPPKKCQKQKKKLNFKTCKKNTMNSLNEVEYFLRNFNGIMKYIKLYKILK